MRRGGTIFAPNVLEGMEEEIDQEDAALKVRLQAFACNASAPEQVCALATYAEVQLWRVVANTQPPKPLSSTLDAARDCRVPADVKLFLATTPPCASWQFSRPGRRTVMRRLRRRGCGCWQASSGTSTARPLRGCCLER